MGKWINTTGPGTHSKWEEYARMRGEGRVEAAVDVLAIGRWWKKRKVRKKKKKERRLS